MALSLSAAESEKQVRYSYALNSLPIFPLSCFSECDWLALCSWIMLLFEHDKESDHYHFREFQDTTKLLRLA